MVLKSNKYYALILSTTILYSQASILYAANFEFTGNIDTNWSNPENLTPDGPPTALDQASIIGNGVNTSTIN